MKIHEFSSWINLKETQHRLSELYPSITEAQKRMSKSLNSFTSYFPNHDEIELFSSSGRVELIGNHTDHQGGLVLSCAIHLDTLAIVSHNHDHVIQCISDGYEPISIRCDDLAYRPSEQHTTQALLRGCLALFSQHFPIQGLDISVDSIIPIGSGLSSSASFECLILSILNVYFGNSSLTPMQIAKMAQKVENVYFGKPSGLLDQLCITHGGVNLLDFRLDTPSVTPIPNNTLFDDYDLCIVKTSDNHSDLSKAYQSIVNDYQDIAHYYHQKRLVDVDESVFYSDLFKLQQYFPSQTLLRAHHFFSEQKRVIKAYDALLINDFHSFLKQVNHSGHSSFEYLNNVLHPMSKHHNIALGLALTQQYLNELGASRVHGGGFAGSFLVITPKSNSDYLDYLLRSTLGAENFMKCKIRSTGVKWLSHK